VNAGCDEVQGFYFSEPVPAGDVESLLAHRQEAKAASC
jgi:EAL domain-containing protein (putative c-di-GMP-specific phosphodiesterase class I)